MDNLYIVMPAYNEESNIETVITQWYPVLSGKGENSKMVIADSGSTDSTHTILVELQKKYPKIEILTHTDRQHGPKVMALYDYAIRNKADYIFQTDSDGQTDCGEFSHFWELRNQYDAVIGNRTARQDGKSRIFVEKVVCILLYCYFGIRIPDANAPFRLMKTSLVEKYLYKLPIKYNLPNIMLTSYFSYYKENLTFIEISFKPRQGGVSSINIPNIIKTGWRALHDFNLFKKDMKR